MRLTGLKSIVRAVISALGSSTTKTPAPTRSPRSTAPTRGRTSSGASSSGSPGQSGAEATTEVPQRVLRTARILFEPRVDRAPDPGEVVWTWVPYEENDGRGKDRPVVIVARDTDRSVFAVQLTSKPHDDDARHFVFVGPGPWDSQGRPSWARLDRVFRVFESGMRREAASLSRAQFAAVATALKGRF